MPAGSNDSASSKWTLSYYALGALIAVAFLVCIAGTHVPALLRCLWGPKRPAQASRHSTVSAKDESDAQADTGALLEPAASGAQQAEGHEGSLPVRRDA